MKKIWIVAIALLLCMGCFVSCASLEQEIGRTASVALLDTVQTELESAGFDTLDRYDQAEIDAYVAELNQDDVTLQAEVTGVIFGRYDNPETGHWVEQAAIGVCTNADAETLVQYYQAEYATEIAEGRAEVVGGGWVVSVTVSSLVLESAE